MTKILIVDTETGGLDETKYSILTLGGVIWEDGELVDSFEVLVKEPELSVSDEALQLNKISLRGLDETGLDPVNAIKSWHAFLELHFSELKGIRLAGHNVGFDVRFMKRLYRLAFEAGLPVAFDSVYSHRLLDTASIVRFLILANKVPASNGGSDAIFKHFDIAPPEEHRHTARGDALATAKLLNCLLETVNGN